MSSEAPSFESASTLSREEIGRYSRQILLPEVGVTRCESLLRKKVLIVGAGGLGSTCCMYLAAGGVLELGIVDHDLVEVSNLHRQIVHPQERTGMSKAESAAMSCRAMNPTITITSYPTQFSAQNAMRIVTPYDIVCDCTDNVTSRYLVSDACVMAGKPLVSGSAVRWEGQLTVYNYLGGVCYRCMFPTPPPRSTVSACSDVGVMGPVPGMVGCLMALEAQKIGMGLGCGEVLCGRMMMFHGLTMTFRVAKLRGRNPACIACGENPTMSPEAPLPEYAEYLTCEIPVPLPSEVCVTPCVLEKHLRENPDRMVVLDVRVPLQHDMCHLPLARVAVVNVPLEEIERRKEDIKALQGEGGRKELYVICRRGIRSSRAVDFLKKEGFEKVYNVDGGLTRWAKDVDTAFPTY